MAEPPHMPTKDEILERAIGLFEQDMIKKGLKPITPTEDELKEGSWFEKARIKLMSGVKSELEGYLSYLESEAESIREELGIKPEEAPRPLREAEEELDRVSVRLHETRTRLKEAKKEIEKLRAVKIPPKIIEAPPPPPEKLMCPAHPNFELLPVIGRHEFRWGVIDVPGEMFLFQCTKEYEYYICEPRKRCELVPLDKLRRRLAAIVKPIAVRVPRREPERIVEAAERQPDWPAFLKEAGITMEDYKRLDRLGQFVMRSEYRRWKMRPY